MEFPNVKHKHVAAVLLTAIVHVLLSLGPASMVRDVKNAAISLNKFMGTSAELKYEIDSFAL